MVECIRPRVFNPFHFPVCDYDTVFYVITPLVILISPVVRVPVRKFQGATELFTNKYGISHHKVGNNHNAARDLALKRGELGLLSFLIWLWIG